MLLTEFLFIYICRPNNKDFTKHSFAKIFKSWMNGGCSSAG